MSDDSFEGIDRGTFSTTSALALDVKPLTARALQDVAEAIAARFPPVPCGTEDSPHRYFGEAKVGDRVRCAVCTERLIVLPNGRAMLEPMLEPKLADIFKAPVPRLMVLEPGAPPVPFEYRYGSLRDAPPLRNFRDVADDFEAGPWRPWPLGRLRRVIPKSFRYARTRRTDFSARGVPEPVLTVRSGT